MSIIRANCIGGMALEKENNLDQVPLGNINDSELKQIQQLEQQLDEKYYLIAFEKSSK